MDMLFKVCKTGVSVVLWDCSWGWHMLRREDFNRIFCTSFYTR